METHGRVSWYVAETDSTGIYIYAQNAYFSYATRYDSNTFSYTNIINQLQKHD